MGKDNVSALAAGAAFQALLTIFPTLTAAVSLYGLVADPHMVERQITAIQGILVKAPLHSPLDRFRNEQLVKARVVWSTAPAPTVPVLAVARIGGQAFVYVAIQTDKGMVAKQRAVILGDTTGNDYAVSGGLQPGEKVIVSGTQFLNDGAPVQPI